MSVFEVLKIPGVMLASASIIVTSMSIGFLQAVFEPHVRSFNLTGIQLGLMFVINGGTYAITAPGFGWLCDRNVNPKTITVIGTLLVSAGFLLVGPAPFIPIPPIMWVTICGLVLHGLGIAAQLVASFTDALRTSVDHGFENNLETYGLISGLWTSTFALGAFIGPSLSGILYDSIGFRNASLFIVSIHIVVGIVVTVFICSSRPRHLYVSESKDASLDHGYSKSAGHNSITESMKSIRSVGNGISIEKSRPPAMNSLIACNSYKSQAWPRRESSSLNLHLCSHSYGTIDNRNGVSSTSYLQGVA